MSPNRRLNHHSNVSQLCALDFKEDNLAKQQLPFRERWSSRFVTIRGLVSRRSSTLDDDFAPTSSSSDMTAVQADGFTGEHGNTIMDFRKEKRLFSSGFEREEEADQPGELQRHATLLGGAVPTRKTSRSRSFSSMMDSTRPIPPTAPLDATDMSQPCYPSSSMALGGPIPLLPTCSNHGTAYSFHHPASPVRSVHKATILRRLLNLLLGMLMPVSLAVIIAIPCSIILPLKALFIDTPGWTGTRMPNAPNGAPPLNFILDTTTFLGGMTVPAMLILLGASFARLKVGDFRYL